MASTLTNPFASELLEVGAMGLASQAASELLETNPEVQEAFEPRAHMRWRDNLQLRVRELAAATASGHAELFLDRVVWSRQVFQARGVEEASLRASLKALRGVIGERLPDNASSEPVTLLDMAVDALDDVKTADPECGFDTKSPLGILSVEYLQHALEGNVRGAIGTLLDALDAGKASADDLIGEVLMTAQAEAGRLWMLNQLTVAEEHLITATTLRAMAMVTDKAAVNVVPNDKTVLAATLPEDHHDIGLRGISHLLELQGWRAFFLGRDVPLDDLISAASYFNVDLVILSASMSIQLRQLRSAISQLKNHGGVRAPILIGGQAFTSAPDAWQSCGADNFAWDARSAVKTASLMVGLT
ncbi:MAG: cobalamin-dependent protein [Pseudomonadota bacterium]